MKCYLIANVVPTDLVRFTEYLEKVPRVIAQYGGRYVVRGGQVHAVEGDFGFERMVVIEFASRDAAQRFYDSEDYEPLLALRKDTARSQVAFVDALGLDYEPGSDDDLDRAVHRPR